MKRYDVVIIGAGPAGGQCARELSALGFAVLLAEKAKSFAVNNYSSGGAPLDILERYALPHSLIGSYWNKLRIEMTNDHELWQATKAKGVILDFMKLRSFLADETRKQGGEVRLDCAYQGHELGQEVQVHFKQESVRTRVLVDATGSERKVLAASSIPSKTLHATGIEYLLKVSTASYAAYASTLSFFLGVKWMPQGYAWIFPMEPGLLKVGVIRYFQSENIVPHNPSHLFYLEQILQEKISEYEILDKHGKTFQYAYGRKDLHCQGPILAIGDAISTINPLASEGIRHALYSGRAAAHHIGRYLKGEISTMRPYQKEMQNYCGARWRACEYVAKQAYSRPTDREYTHILNAFRRFTLDEMMDLAFYYRPFKFLKYLWFYYLEKVRK